MSITGIDCSAQQVEVELEGNPDISGMGVLIGFMGTAYLAVLITLGYYVFAFDPEKDPADPASTVGSTWSANPIDKFFLGALRRVVGRVSPRWVGKAGALEEMETAFNQCFIQLCDIQMITGIAILIAAFSDLGSGISAYHWQMAVYLAWFANLTHLSGLTFLRKYLYSHQNEWNWRVFAMTIIFLILLVSEVPTIFFNWPNATRYTAMLPANPDNITDNADITRGAEFEMTAANASSLARCYFNLPHSAGLYSDQALWFTDTFLVGNSTSDSASVVSLSGSAAFQSGIISILMLVFSFTTRCIKLSKVLTLLFRNRIRPLFSNLVKRAITWGHLRLWSFLARRSELLAARPDDPTRGELALHYLYTCPLLCLIITVRLYADLYSSMLSEIYWLTFSAIWGSLHIFSLRNSAALIVEDEFSFGQVVAVVLLAAPMLGIIVSLWPFLPPLCKKQESETDSHAHRLSNSAIELQTTYDRREQLPPRNETPVILRPSPSERLNVELLHHNYYQEPWASHMISFAGLQIFLLTTSTLIFMSYDGISALKAFSDFAISLTMVQPFVCYTMVVFNISFQDAVNKWMLYTTTLLLLTLTSILPIVLRGTATSIFRNLTSENSIRLVVVFLGFGFLPFYFLAAIIGITFWFDPFNS